MSDKKIYAIVLAGGTGTRIGGDIPKQYLEIGGKPIISFCVDTLTGHEKIAGIIIVANAMWRDYIAEHVSMDKMLGFADPGENRQLSIYNGMLALQKHFEAGDGLAGVKETKQLAVFVHDAARPNLSQELISRIIEALPGHDGVLPVLPMKDTVYLSQDGKRISSLLERSQVVAGQAPELFDFVKYMAANERLMPSNQQDGKESSGKEDSPIMHINGSTEPAILAGMDIAIVPGEETNYKITTLADLERFKQG